MRINPADTYIVVNKTLITDKDNKVLTMLYQPIIGHVATSLYNTLLSDLDEHEIMSEDLTHHHLMSTMQLNLDDILISRQKLEAVGLLKSYLKKDNVNQYVYILYSPLEPSEFFNHPILNIVLYNNLGKKEYEKILNYYKLPKINLKDHEDITATFNDVFTPVKGNIIEVEENIVKRNTGEMKNKNVVDLDMIIESIPKKMLNDRCFNEEIKELINNLAYIYNLNSLEMQGIVRESINERGLIDKNELRRKSRDYYKFENGGNLPTLIYNKQPDFLKKPKGDNSKWAKMVYTFENISPIELLRKKSNGGEPTDRDKRMIENLMADQKLNPGVINVLLSYVLKTNNQKLNKDFIETIAGQWKRANIETVEEAMIITEKEHKKLKKIIEEKKLKTTTTKNKEQQVPAWFSTNQDIRETTQEEVEELDKLLSEII